MSQSLDQALAKTKSKKTVWALAIVLVALGGVGTYYWTQQKTVQPQYRTVKPKIGAMEVQVFADGTLYPEREVSIGSELSGTVRTVYVDVNDQVKKGDVLIALDDTKLLAERSQAQARLQSAKAQYAQAQVQRELERQDWDRQKLLYTQSKGQLPSKSDLEKQRMTYKVAQSATRVAKAQVAESHAALRTIETDLTKTRIVSPIDGIVLQRSVEPGYAVAASLQAVELLLLAEPLKNLELQIDIDEADVGSVRRGQKARFTVSAYPNQSFRAELKKVSFGRTDTENVITYTGYLKVHNDNLLLRPGMTASAQIQTNYKENVLWVPNVAFRFVPQVTQEKKKASFSMHKPPMTGTKKVEEVIQQARRDQTLYVLKDGVATPVTVRTGLNNGYQTEILSDNLTLDTPVIIDQRKKAS